MKTLFPYRLATRSSLLAAYQQQARQAGNPWLLGIALAILAFNLGRGYFSSADAEEVTWSALRTAEVELSVAGIAEDWSPSLRRLLGLEGEDETLEDLTAGLLALKKAGSLTEQGIEALDGMRALQKDDFEGDASINWQEKYEEGLWAWERLAARQIFEENPPEWWLDAEADYRDSDERLAWTAASGGVLWLLVFLAGLPFVPAALRCFQIKNHRPLAPATRAWRPRSVTTRYLVTDLIAGFFLTLLFLVIPSHLWSHFSGALNLATDSLWRVSGTLLLGAVLLIRWRDGFRLLGLTVRPLLAPVLGMMSLGFMYDFALNLAIEPWSRSEQLTGLNEVEDGAWGLAFALVSGVVLAPIFEEVVYRGVLFQAYLRRLGFVKAVLLSTFFFTVIHFYGFQGSLSVAFFGFAACALLRATGSLWTGILFHALTNGMITLTMWPLYHRL